MQEGKHIASGTITTIDCGQYIISDVTDFSNMDKKLKPDMEIEVSILISFSS